MKASGISFHHPWAFWLGCLLITAGVFGQSPVCPAGRHTHWRMVGRPMATGVHLGRAAIPGGLAFAT